MNTSSHPHPLRSLARRHRIAVSMLALALVAAACGSGSGSADTDAGGDPAADGTVAADTTEAPGEPVDFSQRGPHPVGQLDLALDDTHPLAVFYPAAAPVPAEAEPYGYSGTEIFGAELADLLPGAFRERQEVPDTYVEVPASDQGPFPVVLYSHGAGSYFRFASRHNAHVASWGYVVISVDHPERGLRAAIAPTAASTGGLDDDILQLLGGLAKVMEANDTPGSVLAGVADTDRVIAEGHSAGGRTSGAAAYEDRIDGWIGQAPVPPVRARTLPGETADLTGFDFATWAEANEPPPVPSLLVAADGDEAVTQEEVRALFDWLDAPRRLVVLEGTGHNVFTDICAPIQAEGGLAAAVEVLGLDPDEVPFVRLGEDGCLPDDAAAEGMWEVIDHLTVAQIRWVFGQDRAGAAASLEERFVQETFPARVTSILSDDT